MVDDVLLNKVATIERGGGRAREEYYRDPATFDRDYTRQDAAILNVQRACEAALDLGQHLICRKAPVMYSRCWLRPGGSKRTWPTPYGAWLASATLLSTITRA